MSGPPGATLFDPEAGTRICFVLDGAIDGVFEGIYSPVLGEWTNEHGYHIEFLVASA